MLNLGSLNPTNAIGNAAAKLEPHVEEYSESTVFCVVRWGWLLMLIHRVHLGTCIFLDILQLFLSAVQPFRYR